MMHKPVKPNRKFKAIKTDNARKNINFLLYKKAQAVQFSANTSHSRQQGIKISKTPARKKPKNKGGVLLYIVHNMIHTRYVSISTTCPPLPIEFNVFYAGRHR